MTPVEWQLLGGAVCYAVTEYWLGRTDKVKAGSVLEAVLNGVKTVCSKFLLKKG
jgi:hypothetical protein